MTFVKQPAASAEAIDINVVNSFLGICVRNLPNLSKIEAAAAVLHWRALTHDENTMMGPLNADVMSKGWIVQDATSVVFVGISEGKLDGKPIKSCSVANVNLSQNGIISELNRKLTLKFLNDETEAGQRYRYWTTLVNDQELLVGLTTDQSQTAVGGSLSAAVKVR